jgi:hypothetical protein
MDFYYFYFWIISTKVSMLSLRFAARVSSFLAMTLLTNTLPSFRAIFTTHFRFSIKMSGGIHYQRSNFPPLNIFKIQLSDRLRRMRKIPFTGQGLFAANSVLCCKKHTLPFAFLQMSSALKMGQILNGSKSMVWSL